MFDLPCAYFQKEDHNFNRVYFKLDNVFYCFEKIYSDGWIFFVCFDGQEPHHICAPTFCKFKKFRPLTDLSQKLLNYLKEKELLV